MTPNRVMFIKSLKPIDSMAFKGSIESLESTRKALMMLKSSICDLFGEKTHWNDSLQGYIYQNLSKA